MGYIWTYLLLFFYLLKHIQVRLKEIVALVNGIYKCGYIAAFVSLRFTSACWSNAAI